jgi:hypothetical protein
VANATDAHRIRIQPNIRVPVTLIPGRASNFVLTTIYGEITMLKRALLLALMLVLAGCQFGNINVRPNGDGTASVTISMSESDVNGLIQAALARTSNPLLRDPRVDLQPGQIVINGTHDRRDGGGSVSGSINVALTVSGGKVQAQITAANIEGVPLSDGRIAELNQQLAQHFTDRVNRDNRNAQVTSINITDSTLDIGLTVSR